MFVSHQSLCYLIEVDNLINGEIIIAEDAKDNMPKKTK